METVAGIWRAGLLGRAVVFGDRQRVVPPDRIRHLRWHPVRLLSCLGRKHYHGAKKVAVDRVASRELATGRFDLFHGWSGEAVRALREAKRRGIPTVIEVPTWHRDKGKVKPPLTKSERELLRAKGVRAALDRAFLVSRQQVLAEYALADLILVLSAKAEETFLAAGVPAEKLFRHSRGVDVGRFTPGAPPPLFRAIFVGSLIRRKGVDLLLEVWRQLSLADAELVLVGTLHPEIEPDLRRHGGPDVRVTGFCPRPEELYRTASVHVFPSTCEGSAKCTYEAAAAGLPQITTREAGDVVVDGLNGLIVPCGDGGALAAALVALYRDRALRERLGRAGRERAVAEFTWDHFRERVLAAYRRARERRPRRPGGG